MQGLMLKLANVDAAGERALRVVSYFDQLGSNSPDADGIVRAAAIIADCSAGLELPRRGLVIRYTLTGEALPGPAPRSAVVRPLGLDGADDGGSVWLERQGEPRELDDFILERLALTARNLFQRQSASGHLDSATGLSDPALAEILVNDRASEAERARAARLMGLQPSSSIRLVAMEPDDGVGTESLVARIRDASEHRLVAAELSRRLALLVIVGVHPGVPDLQDLSGRLGAGPVVETLDAPRSWAIARDTLRFAGAGTPWPRTLHSEHLGVLRLLARIDLEAVSAEPDVIALDLIGAEPGGQQSLSTLDNFLHAGSLREAARASNLHHSSLQSRIDRLGQRLKIDLSTPAGRQRARLALLLWRSTR